jgi:hypothetical protein
MATTKVTNRVLEVDSVGTAQLSAGAVTTKLGSEIGSFNYRNKLINGDFKFDTRAGGALVTYTGTASQGDTYRSADRWAMFGAPNITQVQRMTIAGFTGLRIRRLNGTNQVTNLFVGQVLERVNSGELIGQQVTLSFVARRGATYSGSGTMGVEIYTGTQTEDLGWYAMTIGQWLGQAEALAQQVPITTTLQRYSFTVTIPSNAQQVGIRFSANQSGTSTADDFLDITQVQLEKGPYATPFEDRPTGLELALCQRYYINGILAGARNATANGSSTLAGSVASSTLPVTMRASPTITATMIAGTGFTPLAINQSSIVSTANTGINGNWIAEMTADAEL